MKNSFLVFIGLLFFSGTAFSQIKNVKVKDPKLNGQEVMIGYCDKKGLSEGMFGVYFESQYEMYKPTEKYIEQMKETINNFDITIVFGTWCSDSKIQVGRFYKVLDKAGYKDIHLKVIGVNRDKNALSVNIDKMDIKLVPTFIVYQNGVELGRIVETPKKSLEKDLAKILKKAE
jgi:thiol-disulfide isomerase/thioredoxin